MKKRITALVLSIVMLFSATTITSFADEYTESEKTINTLGEDLLQGLVGLIAKLIKDPADWVAEDEYFKKNGVADKATEFVDEAQGDYWYLGYGSGSLQTGKELECYVGGSLSVTKKLATEVRDDQRVRTVAVSDGRAVHVFASLDCFGFANSEVVKVRKMLEKYAKENNIASINISSLHQHSCVDTYGMNGDIVNAILLGPVRNILGIENPSGMDPDFMDHLYKTVIKSVEDAVEAMEPGNLYYGAVDASKYIRDKRDPQVIDPNINRFRFVPLDAESNETWLVNTGIHTVGMGASGTIVTADYPYYMEKYIKEETGANFIMIQGAELAITSEYGEELVADAEVLKEYNDEGYARLASYGYTLGELTCSIQDSKKLDPILNYARATYTQRVENNIITLAAKCGLLSNTVVKSGDEYKVVTELGYIEFGKDVAVVVAPGELAPEIAFGGATTAEESWSGTTWDFAPIKDNVDGRTLIVFGLTNGQVGYMLTDNSWHSFLCENEEIVTAGPDAGSTFTLNFYTLLGMVR